MYHKILVPVDLAHLDKLYKALNTAIDIGKHYGASLCYVAVTNTAPSEAAHNPEELAEKLAAFAKEQAEAHNVKAKSRVMPTADTAVELDKRLLEAIETTGSDLVVMASHSPGIGDRLHILHSNGANLVKHSDVSVFVVR